MRERADIPIWAWTDITYLMHEHGVDWAYYIGDDTCVFNCSVTTGPNTRCRSRTHSRGSRRSARPDRWTDPAARRLLRRRRRQDDAVRVVGHALQRRGGAPEAGEPIWKGQRRHEGDQRADARPRLERDRDLPDLGRLGRLLRPRPAAGGGSQRLRDPGPRPPHQPVGPGGFIDSQTLSFDAYLKFIEDLFLSRERLNPGRSAARTRARPSARAGVDHSATSSASSTSPRTRSRRSSWILTRNRGVATTGRSAPEGPGTWAGSIERPHWAVG